MSGIERSLGTALIGACLLVAGCENDPTEQAREAYEARDFATASALADQLAANDNPVGYELLALMAAQGLGREVDYRAAVDLIDGAVRIDPSYEATKQSIVGLVARDAKLARDTFERGHYDRAYTLARALAAFGNEDGIALERDLVTGHLVTLDGSELSWLEFWTQCSGNTRRETTEQTDAAFAELCAGRQVVWDGKIKVHRPPQMRIKMRPGRAHARYDLLLNLAEEPDDRRLTDPDRKVRFSGIVEKRGDSARPDVISDVRIIGFAPMTPDESDYEREVRRQQIIAACQQMAEAEFREHHTPKWASDAERRQKMEGRRRGRGFYFMIGVTSKADVFAHTDQGDWQSRFDGFVSIQSIAAEISARYNFIADCTIDDRYRKGEPPTDHGRVEIVEVTEEYARYPTSPRRARQRQRGD